MSKPAVKSLSVRATQILSEMLKSSLTFGRTPGAMVSLALSSATALGNLSIDKVFDRELHANSKHEEPITRQNPEIKELDLHALIIGNIQQRRLLQLPARGSRTMLEGDILHLQTEVAKDRDYPS